nr:PREDICTED: uncharacterized protein LOC103277830 [Anolis carolinensis]|eukprot:XP_008102647.1 PREDICTED: uncharacterized protein LOC103277830 [Anolis carolinensis]
MLNTETAAMKDEKVMDTSDAQRPKSCREKFLHAWNEKLKLQSDLSLPAQVQEGQSAIGVPDHEKRTGDGSQPSQLLTGPSSEPNETAFYFVMVAAPCSQCSLPRSFQEAESLPHHLPLAPCGSTADWETGDEEEFLHICTSDIVLQPPARKRPRLLPPERKMYVEVHKREAQTLREEHLGSLAPLAFNPLVDATVISTLADLPQMESFYWRNSPRQRGHQSFQGQAPICPSGEGVSPGTDLAAANLSHAQQEHLRLESSTSQPGPMMTSRESMNSSQNAHLPPKKRYTREWRQKMGCNGATEQKGPCF